MREGITAQPRIITVRRRERLFYVGIAVLILITVFAGFSRSYFLKAHFGTPELSLLLHVHGLVFTSWILLFLAQTTLVATRRTDIHRRLGVLGGVLAVVVVIIGMATAIIRVKQGATVPGVPPLSFLAVPFFDMVVFAILVGGAFHYRHRADVHKRVMTLATIALLPAPHSEVAARNDSRRRSAGHLRPGRSLSSRLSDLRSDRLAENPPGNRLWRAGHSGLSAAAADDLGNSGVDSVRFLADEVVKADPD